MQLALSRQFAVDVFADRLKDGQIHYGLVFALPAHADCAAARKHSDLDTRSRHGRIANWWLGVPWRMLPQEQVVLLIPRTWLIRQGFLPWWVMLMPRRRVTLRRLDALQAHVWLEWPLHGGIQNDFAVARAA